MEQCLRDASQTLADDLLALLEDVDPARWRAELEAAARQRVANISNQLRTALDSAGTDANNGLLVERLKNLKITLETAFVSVQSRTVASESVTEARAAWATFQREVQPAYEDLVASLRADPTQAAVARSLRPTNYARNAFHITCGLTVTTCVELLPSRAWLFGIPFVVALWAWSAEISRRIWPSINESLMKMFGRVAHSHERHRVNSSTWFVTALTILGAAFPRYSAAVGVVVLGLADPAAALVGRRFGRTRLRAGRSLEGTAAFFVVGTLAAFTVLSIAHTGTTGAKFATAVIAAFVGAIAELYTESLDDNFTIPLASAMAAFLSGWALGLG
jgi:dolichol kinase